MNIHNKKELGNLGEQIASQYLQKNNYEIKERNFYCKQGEIDIIAKKHKEIIFIEVKTRSNKNFGFPAEAVNTTKKKHIYQTAKYYLYKNKLLESSIRFDVIEVMLVNGRFEVNHIKQIM